MDLGLGATLMNRQCLQALLIISGVEQNPGPVTGQAVIDGLCGNAQTEEIKKVLKSYPLSGEYERQKKALMKARNAELISALEYLKVTNQDKCNKEQLAHNLIIRIQNLLPDTCSVCHEQYNTSLDDVPLLTCDMCGQGSHNPCVISTLGIDESEVHQLDPQKARKMIIPSGLPGVHYFCKECTKEIPDANAGITSKKAHNRSEDKSPEESQPSVDENSSLPLDQNIADTDSSTDLEINASQTQPNGEPDAVQPEMDHEARTEANMINSGGRAQERTQGPIQRANQRTNRTDICSFYRKGRCRHGTNGKGCKYQHPQPCRKLLRNGAKEPNGCTLGRNRCDKFHPNMCSASMTKGECTNTSCKFWHVAGTRRKSKKQISTAENQKGANIQKANQVIPMETPITNSNDFLDFFQKWRTEIMEAMDVKLTMAMKPPLIPPPRPYPVETMPMFPNNHVIPQNYYNLAMGGQRNMTTGQPMLVQMAPNVMYH